MGYGSLCCGPVGTGPPLVASMWRQICSRANSITKQTEALFTSPQNPKTFQDSPSHRILGHMHEALDIDENKN